MKTYADNFVTINGYRVRYWESGDKTAQPLLLLHGFAMAVESWGLNLEALSTKFRIIALDFPGFGKSQGIERNIKIDFLSYFVKDFLDYLQLSNEVYVLGHSMGGMIALRFAQIFPTRLAKLVLVSSAGLNKQLPLNFRLLTVPFLGEYLIRPNKGGIRSSLRNNMYFPESLDEHLVEILYQMSLADESGRKSLLYLLRQNSNIFGMKSSYMRMIKEDLHKVAVPTLLLWGREDPLAPLQGGLMAQEKIKGSRLLILEQCGHFPQLEKSAEFNQLILDSL